MNSVQPRFPWLVPTALSIAVVSGSFLAVLAAILASPTQIVGSPLTGLDTRFLAIFFGAPTAALIASAVSYVGVFTRRPVSVAVAATVAGIAAATIIGFETPAIGAWWVSALPTDTNRAGAILTLLLTPPVTVSMGLASEAIRGHPPTTKRSHLLGLLSLSIFFGFFVGMFVGSVAGALTLSSSCQQGVGFYCAGFSVPFVIEEGGLFGGWIGVILGAASAGIVWLVRPRIET